MSTISVNPLEEKVDVLKHKNVTVPKGTKTQDYALKFVAAALSSEFISPSASSFQGTTHL